MARISKLAVYFAMAVVLAVSLGCAPQPVRNVSNAPVVTSTKTPSIAEIGEAIKRAGVGLGWAMREQQPGKIVGTLALRTHTAVVNIDYDTASYSINYADSTELKYDAAKGTIHKNYNSWVQNLNNAIRAQLSAV
jgi:hypothetical protein